MSGTIDQAIAWAQAQLGQPYLYGGEGGGGFDCSGLMQMAYRAAGVALPRTAQQQYDAVPKVTAPAAGDLVFYGTSPSDITHVGLYLGGGKMLDAPHTGAQVRVENVWSGVIGYGRPIAGSSATSSTTAQLVDATSSGSTSAQPAGFFSSIGSTFERFTVEAIVLGGGVVLVGLGLWKGTTAGRSTSSKVHELEQQGGNAAAAAGGAGGGKGKASGEGAAAGGAGGAAELGAVAAI